MTFTLVHSSGRYDRPLDAVDHAAQAYAHEAEGGLVTWTEQGSDDRHRPHVYRIPDWSFYRAERDGDDHGDDECVVQWGPRFVLDGDPSDDVLVRAKGYRPVVAATVPLRSAAFPRRRVVVSVAHMLRPTTPRRRELWNEALVSWHDHLRTFRRAHPGVRMIVVADWNKNLRRKDGRHDVDQLARNLGLSNGWEGHLPPKGEGTHGRAVIDGALTDLDVVNCRLVADQADSDHRAFALSLNWRQ